VVRFLGLFPYPTRMAVVRLRDGGLWVWSPIALDEALAEAVTALGPVRHLVSPNKLHHLYLGPWKQRFPEARLYASPGLARRRADLAFDAELTDAPDAAWAEDVDQVIFRGSFFMDDAIFFHRATRTALVADLVQRFDPRETRGCTGFLMRLDGLVGERGSTPREWRACYGNRRAGRAARDAALAWDPRRLVVAHGMGVEEGARDVLARALAWLG
jgi:hypothetical protein